MGRPKLWENCSQEDKDAVEKLETLKRQLIDDYGKGFIPKEQYHRCRKKLLLLIDLVEKKQMNLDDFLKRKQELLEKMSAYNSQLSVPQKMYEELDELNRKIKETGESDDDNTTGS